MVLSLQESEKYARLLVLILQEPEKYPCLMVLYDHFLYESINKKKKNNINQYKAIQIITTNTSQYKPIQNNTNQYEPIENQLLETDGNQLKPIDNQ